MMQKWEYLIDRSTSGTLEDRLHACGEEGWELINMRMAFKQGASSIDEAVHRELIFKRPRGEAT